jgi:prepilin-type N-terminal cleavage/methylation domain-containing protein
MSINQQGFTLIEMLLCMSILVVLVGLSLPFYQSFQSRSDLAATAQQVAETIRRAQTYAQGVSSDAAWSVEFQAGSVTLFQGTSYAGRNTSYDEVVTLPGSVSLSGSSEVQFTKLSGMPNAPVSVTLTSTTSGNRAVSVNAKGMVQD